MTFQTQSAAGLSPEAQKLLAWLQQHYWGGRSPVYSVQEIARGLYGRTESPAPGTTYDPSAYGRIREAIVELETRGLVEQGRLPQGDFGYRLVV